MSKEPWKRAYSLSRSRQAAPAPASSDRLPRRRFPWAALLGGLAIVALAAGGYYVWTNRGVLIPKYDKQLPAPVQQLADRTPLPPAQIDLAELDSGLGIGLAVGGDYTKVLEATKGWKVDWKVTVLGKDHVRLTMPGIKVNADDGKISTYELDVQQVFADKTWAPWLPALLRAGVSPQLNWRTATGAGTMPHGVTQHLLTGQGGRDFGGVPAHTAYTFDFKEGWLAKLEAGVSVGEIITPPAGDAPAPDAAPPSAAPPAPASPAGPQ